MEHNFTHGPADDGIHDYITCHDYRPERMVTIGQILFGTLATFALAMLYVGFAWLEG
jgi:hypothetical protein